MTSFPYFAWELPAIVTDWGDGDTCGAVIGYPRGLEDPDWPVRVLRLYCPELHDPETKQPQPGSLEAKAYAEQICPAGTFVRLKCRPFSRAGRWTSTQESLGRLLADIVLPDTTYFSDRMVDAGLGWHTHVPGSGYGIVNPHLLL